MAKIALTGIKPTGTPHIGNYLGAIKPALELTQDYFALYFIADYHALTTVRDKKAMASQVHQIAATWLASGLDPDKTVFYRQSDVPEIFELSWILSCFTPKGLLNRAHSYKASVDVNLEKSKDSDAGINAGLFYYPVLMAADILLFGSHAVPVGQDQKQHLEIARDIAQNFNQNCSKVFRLPEAVITKEVKLIPGLDGRKMSKSYNNVIPLYESPQTLKKSIMRIQTDSKGVEEPKEPDNCPLFGIFSFFAEPEELATVRSQYLKGGLAYGELKQRLFELLEAYTRKGREHYEQLMADPAKIDEILAQGGLKARKMAAPLLAKARKAIGIDV